jgi:hypothetical protein
MKKYIITISIGGAIGARVGLWFLQSTFPSGANVAWFLSAVAGIGLLIGIVAGKNHLSAWFGLYLGQLAVCPFQAKGIAQHLDPAPEMVILQVVIVFFVISLPALLMSFVGHLVRKVIQKKAIANPALHGTACRRP